MPPKLHSEFKASLDYIARSCLKTQEPQQKSRRNRKKKRGRWEEGRKEGK